MKLIHLSDLHLGKRVNGFSMLEDQRVILQEILQTIRAEKPDAVLLAGDIYDKPVPPVEAIQLFDAFLADAVAEGARIFAISGNHDSPERISFGAQLMQMSGVYFSPTYHGTVSSYSFEDAFGTVTLHLLPFVKPAHVRPFFPEEEIETEEDAVRAALSVCRLNPQERHVLLAHQFFAGAARCESEELSIGGAEGINVQLLDAFDYVALGHLHTPQAVTRETVRYCGTPLSYSFSEVGQPKSVTVAELAEKGNITIRQIPLHPLHKMREMRGTFAELTAFDFYSQTETEDYLHITLTDENDIPDAIGRLRKIYPNIMRLDYDNVRTRSAVHLSARQEDVQKAPMTLFEEFYALQNNQRLSDAQSIYLRQILDELWAEE